MEEKKIAQKVTQLKALKKLVRIANGVETSMQQSIADLAKLGEVYPLDDGLDREELHYNLGRNIVGMIDVKMLDRGIIFTSDLLDGVKYEAPASDLESTLRKRSLSSSLISAHSA